MKGYSKNIENETIENTNFRRVVYTGSHTQLVLMSLVPGEEIGNEVHEVDQFFRFEKGQGKVILNNGETEYAVQDGFAVIVPSGTWHNIINTGEVELKIYTLYSPPEHKDGTVHKVKSEAIEEHFDGITTEQK